MTATKGPLLRLVRSLDPRRSPRPYAIEARLSRIEAPRAAPLRTWTFEGLGPRTFVVGNSPRADIAGPDDLLPRHLALIVVPRANGVHLRLLSLQPERALLPFKRREDIETNAAPAATHGGVVSPHALVVAFDGYVLEVEAQLLRRPGRMPEAEASAPALLPMGEQLAFSRRALSRGIGTALTSVSGPETGGHAIPALLSGSGEGAPCQGTLALRTRDGCVRALPSPEELRRGVLIGRSRRCLLGQGIHENDGLSRLHALVMAIDGAVYAFDLASRYGLRDISRPSRLLPTVRIDDGIGCLVYGAGHLVFER